MGFHEVRNGAKETVIFREARRSRAVGSSAGLIFLLFGAAAVVYGGVQPKGARVIEAVLLGLFNGLVGCILLYAFLFSSKALVVDGRNERLVISIRTPARLRRKAHRFSDLKSVHVEEVLVRVWQKKQLVRKETAASVFIETHDGHRLGFGGGVVPQANKLGQQLSEWIGIPVNRIHTERDEESVPHPNVADG